MKPDTVLPALSILLFLLLTACDQGTGERPESGSMPPPAPQPLLIEEASIHDLQSMMAQGSLTAVSLVEYYLHQIETLNPELNAVLETNPEALTIAAALDAERLEGNVRSALHGIPLLLKDNIDTADGMKTTAGSLALLDAPRPARDAFLVQQLREAGAIILGKANLSEWANFRSSQSSSGWSARGGQTRNPYAPAYTPCGSSSGSAVAVTANMVSVAIGTETDGSIICPAANNGVVGIKPSLGLISRSGIIPIAHSQDTAGPLARTVSDAAVLLSAMVATDPADSITENAANAEMIDYTQFLQAGALNGKRIGVLRTLFTRNPQVDQLMQTQLQILQQAGAELIDVDMTLPAAFNAAEFEVLLYEFKHDLNAYLQNRGGEMRSLADLIRFNRDNAETAMPYFGQELFEQAQTKGDLTDPAYLEALANSKRWSQGLIDDALLTQQLDAFVAPSNGPGWAVDLEQGDQSASVNYVSSSSLAAVSGYPSITVPAGFIAGRPVGLSFFAGAFSEPELLALAYDYELNSKARKAP
ncbi:MAG: amidase [Pseudomonadales bacterium]|nr:amidase [Pseudomonadales bacterium]